MIQVPQSRIYGDGNQTITSAASAIELAARMKDLQAKQAGYNEGLATGALYAQNALKDAILRNQAEHYSNSGMYSNGTGVGQGVDVNRGVGLPAPQESYDSLKNAALDAEIAKQKYDAVNGITQQTNLKGM